jgi:hypothetical protein
MNHLIDAFRLISWRGPRNPDAALSPRAILAIFLVLGVADLAAQWVVAGGEREFSLYGVNAIFAWLGASLAVIALFTRHDPGGSVLRHLILLWSAGASALILCELIPTSGLEASAQRTASVILPVTYAVVMLSMGLGARQAFRAAGVGRPGWRGAGFALVLTAILTLLPSWPAFIAPTFQRSQANFWEAAAAVAAKDSRNKQQAERENKRRNVEARAARIESAQPALLDRELARLAPRAPKKPNLFVVGVAGWSDQDVFLKETEKSLDIIGKRLGAESRTLALVNNLERAETRPIANIHNLSHVLRGIAQKMNFEEDVLLLTMTSHGSREGFALEYGPLVERTLQPQTLKAMLDSFGFKNRIVIVSACYSGVFIPALEDSRTMVITAASATRTSFGCADDRDWTYFGDAFFAHGLTETPSLTQAYEKARTLIGEWEKKEKSTPSDPQIFVGEELRRRFPALVGAAPSTSAATRRIRESYGSVPRARTDDRKG